MCLSDNKFKKRFEANSIRLKKLILKKETELKVDLFKESYINIRYLAEKNIFNNLIKIEENPKLICKNYLMIIFVNII